MKISKDFKIGIIGLVTIILLLMLVNFIRKSELFDSDETIHAVFATAAGIEKNNRVLIKGLEIGTVSNMEPADKNLSGVKVSFKIHKNLNIPVNSVASIGSAGAISPNVIIIEKGNSKTYLKDGDVIKTKSGDISSKIKAQVKPLEKKINTITDSLSKVLNQFNTSLNTSKQAELRERIASLNMQMAQYFAMSKSLNQNSKKSVNNLSATSTDYVNRSEGINKMLRDANKKANELAQMRLERKVDSINKQISAVRSKLNGLSSGQLGNLINDRKAYNSLSEQLTQSEIMLDDIRVNPKRYIDYSVLGKSSKAPELTEPEAAKQRAKALIEFNRKQQEQYKNK